jgi:peptide/nickel transport system permease protein
LVNFIVRRFLIAIPVLFGISIINFAIMNLAPGSPIDAYIDPNVTGEMLEARKESLGLNDPIHIQYLRWLGMLLQGSLGYSISSFQPVTELVFKGLAPTMLLAVISLIVAILIAIPVGIFSAVKRNSKFDYIVTGLTFMGASIPNFFLGLALIYIFSLTLGILPTGGTESLTDGGGLWDKVKHMILPVIVMTTSILGRLVRYVRSSILEVLKQDYLRTARAKGIHEFFVLNKHALRNALIPIITIVGTEIPIILSMCVVIEQVFQWPGIGQLTLQAILSRDYPILMGVNIVVAVIVLLTNLVTDILYSIADPRVKY